MTNIEYVKHRIIDRFKSTEAQWYSSDDFIKAYKNKEALRKIALDENWHQFFIEDLERWIERGEEHEEHRKALATHGKHFDKLWIQMIELNMRWKYFHYIFVEQNEETKAYFKVVPQSLIEIQGTDIFDAIIGRIYKLVKDRESYSSGIKINNIGIIHNSLIKRILLFFGWEKPKNTNSFTLGRFIKDVCGQDEVKLTKFKDELNEIRQLPILNRMQEWRNCKISHLSYDVIHQTKKLPTLCYTDIQIVIDKLNSLFSELSTELVDTTYHAEYSGWKNELNHLNTVLNAGNLHLFYIRLYALSTYKWETTEIPLHPDFIKYLSEHQGDDLVKNLKIGYGI